MQLRDPVPFRPWIRDGKTQIRDKLPDPQHWVSIIMSLEEKKLCEKKFLKLFVVIVRLADCQHNLYYFHLDCVMAEVYAPRFLVVIQENTASDGVQLHLNNK